MNQDHGASTVILQPLLEQKMIAHTHMMLLGVLQNILVKFLHF